MTSEGQPLLELKKEEEKRLYGSLKTAQPDERITYTWTDLNVFATEKPRARFLQKSEPRRKHILKNVSGVACPGELLAILGSSGAGKTTLLNSLTFRSSANMIISGYRCSNGIPLTQTSLTSLSAYVQQDDLFFPHLTIKEHLIFHAMVRMDKSIPYKMRINRVNEVIAELSLSKCQNTRIGTPGAGISGGERKRLAFAAEVLTNPSLMFCDEPTSGLDSFMALNVVQVLKNLAQTGKTVICTIHQPSSELYTMFDKILLMAEGRVAFLGTPEQANTFFSSLNAPCPPNYNPADYFIQLLAVIPDEEESCKQAIDMICSTFENSQQGQSALESSSSSAESEFWTGSDVRVSPYKASWCTQFRAVLWRSWISVVKEPVLNKIRLLQTIMVSLVIGIVYFGQVLNEEGVMNINGAMFIFLTSMTFQNIFAVVSVFCGDFPIFLREHLNGMYRTDVYFLCKTLAELPIFTFLPVIYIGICYYMIGLNPDVTRFFITMGIVALVSNVAISFGYFISCITTSESMAMSIGPPLNIPFLLFGGFFLNVASIPFYFKWLSYFSWFRYANEALMINQWSGVNNISCTDDAVSCPKNGEIVLKIYNFTKEDFGLNIGMLFALVLIFRLFAYFALLCRTMK